MHHTKSTLIAVLLMASTSTSHAQIWSARNEAMGGTGVASGNYDAASGINPALLTEFGDRDDIALVLPVLGAEVSDNNDVVETLDDISGLFDDLENQIDTGQNAAAVDTASTIVSGLEDISGKPVRANLGGRLGVAVPGKTFAFAVDLRTALEGGAIGIYDETDRAILVDAISSGDSLRLDDINSFGFAMAAGISELAFSMATEFTPGNQRLSIGITPKYQRVDTLLYLRRVNDFDSNDFEASDYSNDDANFNMDIGVAWWFAEKLNIGLAIRDLISNDYKTLVVSGYQATYKIQPQATAGIAWNGDTFTFAFDGDLNKHEGFEQLGDTQFLRAGFEFNAADWAALRAGYRHDLEDSRENVFTLGVGFSPFTVFHFDLTGMVGNNDTYGGVLELKFML